MNRPWAPQSSVTSTVFLLLGSAVAAAGAAKAAAAMAAAAILRVIRESSFELCLHRKLTV